MDANPVEVELVERAVDYVLEAGEVTLRWFRHPELAVDEKGDGSPVTAADLAAETLLRERIAEGFPDSTVMGEEHEDTAGSGPLTWMIDPIDGTKAFTRGVPLYCNLLAVSDAHGMAVSIINLPALGETVVAARGRGCTWNGAPCRVSERDEMAGAVLTTSGFDYWDPDMLTAVHRSDVQMRTWGDGYGYALVATGRAEIMVDPVVAPWDIAGMGLLLAEAGGRFTALDGSDDIGHGTGLATNGLLHGRVLSLVAPG